MLFVPLATGATLGTMQGGRVAPVILLATVALFLFCLRTPVESLWGTSAVRAQSSDERQYVRRYIVAFATLAALPLSILLLVVRPMPLLVFGGVAALMFAAQALVRQTDKQWRIISQMLGAVGLTSTAPAAYYVSAGQLDGSALAIWAANWLFAGNQIHYVQMRLHSARLTTGREKLQKGRAFLSGQAAMLVALVLLWNFGLLPVFAMIAFLPVFARGVAWFFAPPQPLSVRRLGFTELAHALAFGVLLVVFLHFR